MQGRGSATGPLPEALEFEGRFTLSSPVTDNQFWWHPEQNPTEQQLPDFIPIPSDTGASYQNLVDEAGWNADSLTLGQPSSSNIKNDNIYNEHLSGTDEWQSSVSAYQGPVSSNLAYQPTTELYQGSRNGITNHLREQYIRPVSIQQSRSDANLVNLNTNARTLGNLSNGQSASDALSLQSSINFYRTGSNFREENNDGPNSTVVTNGSSQKRKFPEGSMVQPSGSGSKRSAQITGSSGWHGTSSSNTAGSDLNLAPPSETLFGVGLPATENSDFVVPPRSSRFDSPPESGRAMTARSYRQQFYLRTSASLQNSVPVSPAGTGNSVAFNRAPLVLPAPQVGGVSDIRSRSSVIRFPVLPSQNTQGAMHNTGSSTISRNSSGSLFAMGTNQVQDMGLRYSTPNLQNPAIPPSTAPRIMAQSALNFGPPGGSADFPENAADVSFLAAHPSHVAPAPGPNLVSNRNHVRRSTENVRQALLAADSSMGVSTVNHPPVYSGNTSSQEVALQSRSSPLVVQPSHQRASSVSIPGRSSSNSRVLDVQSPFETENGESFFSQARYLLARYRGVRNLPLEEGVAARASLLSALSSLQERHMQDRHRELRLDVDNMTYEELLELGERIGDVKTGLSEETIMSCLKHTKHTSSSILEKSEVEPCSICQEDYAEGEDMGSLECGHDYHTSCIKQWLVLKNSCPICKVAASTSK